MQRREKVPPAWCEQSQQIPGNIAVPPQGGTKGGARRSNFESPAVSAEVNADPALARVIAAWPHLRDDVKAAIRSMVADAASHVK